jgi:hypothetical protein
MFVSITLYFYKKGPTKKNVGDKIIESFLLTDSIVNAFVRENPKGMHLATNENKVDKIDRPRKKMVTKRYKEENKEPVK